ncbi:single hybrid motif-containing protein [Chiua virens]|nr:single hybrid motif-containing protein [Chiua virens]
MPAAIARLAARRLHTSARRHALSRFAMPAMSPTMTEGGIASWKKSEGESFSVGDVLLEIETDKASIDVEAQDDGILAKIIALGGSKNVAVGTPIAILAEEGDDLSAAVQMAAEAASSTPAPAQQPPEPAPSAQAPPTSAPQPQAIKSELPKGDRIFASPIAKKIALEKGIPLAQIKGTGPDGRIIRDDVEKYQSPAPSASPPLSSTATPASPDYIDTPVSNMRKVIGMRLTASKQDVPHYYLTVDINMDKVLKLREVFNKTLGDKDKAAETKRE